MNISDEYLIECIERALGALESIAENTKKVCPTSDPKERAATKIERTVNEGLDCGNRPTKMRRKNDQQRTLYTGTHIYRHAG